jgi:hypothetical protein
MGAINSYLDEYIKDIVSNYRSIICRVLEKNGDGSFDVQPVTNDPIIYDVIIFKSSILNTEPAIGSFCIVSFLDDMNAFISHIFDFKNNVIDSKETTIIRSDGIIIQQAKNKLTVISENEDKDKLNGYIDSFKDKAGYDETYSDYLIMNSTKSTELTVGDSKVSLVDDTAKISVKESQLSIKADGVTIQSDSILSKGEEIISQSGSEKSIVSSSSIKIGKFSVGTIIDSGFVQVSSSVDLKYNGGVNSIMSDLLQIMPILTSLDAALLSGANAAIITSLTSRLTQNISITT